MVADSSQSTLDSVSTPSFKQALLNRRMLICIFTGFTSGLPLYLLIQLVPAWLRVEGVGPVSYTHLTLPTKRIV
mgnify:CR=1 FL=1